MWIVKFKGNDNKERQTQPFNNLLSAQLAQVMIVALDPYCKIEEIETSFNTKE